MSTDTSTVSSFFEGAYWIRSLDDNSVLAPGGTEDGGIVPVISQDKLAAKQILADYSQMWLIEPLTDGVSFTIRNAQSGNVLDVKGSNTDDGTPIIIYQQLNNPNQQWKFEWVDDVNGSPYYRIVNIYTKKCLTNNGGTLYSDTWSDEPQKRFALEPVVFPPVHWISHAKTGWYLQYNKSDGSLIVGDKISATADTRSQLWFLEPEPDSDAYIIVSLEDDQRVLDLSQSGTADGTPVIAWSYSGGTNQQWLINDIDSSDSGEDRVKIVSALSNTVLSVSEGAKSGTVQIDQDKGDNDQTWRLQPYPFPSVYWSTLQNLQTGTFLKQNGSLVSPSSGMANAVDYSVQWRFLPDKTQPHHYTIINRATNQVIMGKDLPPTVAAVDDSQKGQYGLWALELAGDGIGIINTTTIGALDHFGGGLTIEATPNNGISNTYHQWLAVQVSDSLPSFALVNNRTGSSLMFKSATDQGGVVMSVDTVNDWSNQWIFQNLSGTDSDSPIYAIINKVSGTVLDHWGDVRIAAENDDTSDTHHQWKLLSCPCGENYFQIQNVATGHYLEEREDGVPNAKATDTMDMDNPTDTDRAQCWELVSNRLQDIDLVTLDDDVLQGTLPYLQPDNADTLRHRIVERAPGKDKKGKDKSAHKPQNPRLLRDISPFILNIFGHVIDEWVEDRLPTTVQAGTRVSTNRREVENRWNIAIPRSLQVGSERDGWIRIDIQGTYETSPGNRVANIQGQWNNDSVFHVIVPLGVTVGREVIRGAMRRSLAEHTSITIEPANSKPPSGGKKPNTTPKPPPGPGGSGNGWVYTSAVSVASALTLAILIFL
ncbi:hypothetical protein ACEPAG_3811 [Sanghuangporus baumii]